MVLKLYLVNASCCKVDVLKGSLEEICLVVLFIFETTNEDEQLAAIASASSLDEIVTLLPLNLNNSHKISWLS